MRMLLFLLPLLIISPVNASENQKNSSRYTALNLNHCKTIAQGENSIEFRCKGYRGERLYVAEGDLRFFIGYGKNSQKQRGASQTPPAFNSIFKTHANKTMIEWRGTFKRNAKGKRSWQRFASIIRFYTGGDGKHGQTLVVTKITPTQSCHVAYINARQANANRKARRVADKYAEDFDCLKEPMQF